MAGWPDIWLAGLIYNWLASPLLRKCIERSVRRASLPSHTAFLVSMNYICSHTLALPLSALLS